MSEYIINNYHGKSIIDTYHSFDRFEERNELTKKDILSWFKRIIDYFNTHDYLEEGNRILVYSPRLDQGVVFHYRKDGKTNKLAYIMITFLERKKDYPKEGTDKYIVERYNNESMCNRNKYEVELFSDRFLSFLTETVKNLKEECEEDIKYLKEISVNDAERGVVNIFDSKLEDTDEDITVVLQDGKYYTYHDIVLEEIE